MYIADKAGGTLVNEYLEAAHRLSLINLGKDADNPQAVKAAFNAELDQVRKERAAALVEQDDGEETNTPVL